METIRVIIVVRIASLESLECACSPVIGANEAISLLNITREQFFILISCVGKLGSTQLHVLLSEWLCDLEDLTQLRKSIGKSDSTRHIQR